MLTLYTRPIHLREANQFVSRHHRHSRPTVGGKFALAVWQADKLVGVAICGRPVARMLDDGLTLEVLRVCTDGARNACSFLYSRAAKIAGLMGYVRLITYTLEEESGASLRAIGAVPEHFTAGREWARPSRQRGSQPIYQERKVIWHLA